MRKAGGITKVITALGSAILFVVAAAPTVGATVTASPPPTAAVTPGPLPSATAAHRAGSAYEERASVPGTALPLVTIETTSSGPRVISHSVTSEAQARAVATAAARGNDLLAVQTDRVVRPIATATKDQYASLQWALDTAKTTFAGAWKLSTGKNIKVAVLDTGVDAKHPDLAGQVLAGRAFLNSSPAGTAFNPATDKCGHGTHVAGTIAALANTIGVAGAAPGVKIIPVKVLDKPAGSSAACSGLSSAVANGITWATNNGARVINLSLGGPGPDSALQAAINYARTKKVVVVAAAGNNQYDKTCNPGGTNAVIYPGASAGVIGVGSIDSALKRSCFSNVGSYVDLVGPGSSILSTYPTNLTPSGYTPYATMSGTSMATPHVAAAAAIMLSRWPTCTSDRVETKLKTTAKRLGGTTGPNTSFGYGLIDPAKAVTAPAC